MAMITSIDRVALIDRYRENRVRSRAIFDLIAERAYYDRPISLRHPFVFYEGHLPAFSFNTLNWRGLHEAPVDDELQHLFERGIDPASLTDAQRHSRADWPERDRVVEFAAACDARVLDALANAQIDDAGVPRLVHAQAAYTILEHEEMHHETLLYIVHQLDETRKTRIPQTHRDSGVIANEMLAVDAGRATLGTDERRTAFGWDNEFCEHAVDVPAFGIQRYPVTNADWLRFLADGGEKPAFWIERSGEWHLRGAFETLRLPRSWPVYVTHRQAMSYARWSGMRLPTEAEYHRAAFGDRDGTERALPWGDAPAEPRFGNFDFQRYDAEPVDAHPDGRSAYGVEDLIGNGWEWTSTAFAPFDGFEPMASYPEYSADFFDGKHFVLKGASPVTSRRLIRRGFRNWFYDDYPYMYAKFRCAV
jgi:gamma-glutamyl hercynylcysteine S-oxide synthase